MYDINIKNLIKKRLAAMPPDINFSDNIGSGFHKMFHGWKNSYNCAPIVDGDFDWYKLTFPIIKTTDKEKVILGLLSNNSYLTADDLGKEVGISEELVRYYLKKLKDKGLIVREGSRKTGKWVAVK